MRAINRNEVMKMVAREIRDPDFPFEEFRDLFDGMEETADHLTQTILLALTVYDETVKFIRFKLQKKRVVTQKKSVQKIADLYLSGTPQIF